MARLFILLVLLYSLAVNARRLEKEDAEKGTEEPVWKKHVEEHNPRKYMLGIGKKFGLIVANTKKYMAKYKNKAKDTIKEEKGDIGKKIGDIRGRFRQKMGEPWRPRQGVEEVEKEVKEFPEAKKEAEESSWSWGQIFGVLGRAVTDLARNTESEEGKDEGVEIEDSRRRRSVVETVEVVSEDRATERETHNEEYAELGKSVSEFVREKGQQYLEDLTQKAKDAVNSSSADMAEKLQNVKNNLPSAKELEKMQEKVKDAFVEENKTWDWMKIIRAVVEGVEEMVIKDSEDPTERSQ